MDFYSILVPHFFNHPYLWGAWLAAFIVLLCVAAYYILKADDGGFDEIAVGFVLWLVSGLLIYNADVLWAQMNKPLPPPTPSKHQQLVMQMFNQHCRLTNLTQGKWHDGGGIGASMSGHVVVGGVASKDSDQYNYTCDSGVTYSVNFDFDADAKEMHLVEKPTTSPTQTASAAK